MRRLLTVLAVATTVLVACGNDDDPAMSASTSSSAASEAGKVADDASAGEEGYRPASNVDEHAAIGRDVLAIREKMEPATKGEPVDWAAVGMIFEKGGASKKSDGSIRTLAGLVADSATVEAIRGAITGLLESNAGSDAVRRQRVDKGISVLLAEKVLEELGRARAKIEKGELEPPATGAVHNVDEAWAFFTAEGQGPAATAEKRAADFDRTGQVKEPVLQALTEAKTAAQAGDLAAFDAATEDTREALAYIFYLATFKYLDHKDEVGRAEGTAFYRGISSMVEAADPAAHKAIVAAFASGDEDAGRAALNAAPVLAALGVSDSEKVTELPA